MLLCWQFAVLFAFSVTFGLHRATCVSLAHINTPHTVIRRLELSVVSTRGFPLLENLFQTVTTAQLTPFAVVRRG